MSEPSPRDNERRLQALSSRHCDQGLDPAEAEELAGLLAGDAERIAAYCEITSLHLDLSQELQPPNRGVRRDVLHAGPTRRRPGFGTAGKALAALAATLLVGVSVWLTVQSPEPAFTAKVVRAIDCRFRDGAPAHAPGALATGDPIELEEGLLIVAFGDGAEVLLEGPTRFVVTASDRGELLRGRLTAHVERRARGFTVGMPGIELVDLGTRFGASVGPTNIGEAHVFDGRVRLSPTDPASDAGEQELVGGEALRFNPTEQQYRRIEARPRAFVHADRFADPDRGDARIDKQFTSRADLAFWFRADSQLQLDESDRVVGWGNLADAGASEHGAAWQAKSAARPTLDWDEKNRRSALRFDGGDHLTTSGFPLDGDQTLVAVYRRAESATDGCLLDTGHAAILQAGEPTGGLAVVVTSYKQGADSVTSYLNGEAIDTPPPGATHRSASAATIGATSSLRQHFVGEIYEVALLSACLSPEESRSLSQERMREYGIAGRDEEPRILAPPSAARPE